RTGAIRRSSNGISVHSEKGGDRVLEPRIIEPGPVTGVGLMTDRCAGQPAGQLVGDRRGKPRVALAPDDQCRCLQSAERCVRNLADRAMEQQDGSLGALVEVTPDRVDPLGGARLRTGASTSD